MEGDAPMDDSDWGEIRADTPHIPELVRRGHGPCGLSARPDDV